MHVSFFFFLLLSFGNAILVILGRFVNVIVCIICLLIWLIIVIDERKKKPLCVFFALPRYVILLGVACRPTDGRCMLLARRTIR